MKRNVFTVIDRELINAIVEKTRKGKVTIVVSDNKINSARIEKGR